MKINDSEVYEIPELVKLLRLHPATILKYCRQGSLKAHKIGRRWFVTSTSLERFLTGDELASYESRRLSFNLK